MDRRAERRDWAVREGGSMGGIEGGDGVLEERLVFELWGEDIVAVFLLEVEWAGISVKRR